MFFGSLNARLADHHTFILQHSDELTTITRSIQLHVQTAVRLARKQLRALPKKMLGKEVASF